MTLAINVFKQIPDPNVHLYNTFIRACVQNSLSLLAFETFFEMQRNGLFADNFTYPFLLKACNGQSWFPLVKMIHNHLEKYGFFQDLFVPNSLIDSYCKCGDMEMARMLFDRMPVKNLVSWTIIVSGYAVKGLAKDAIRSFEQMEEAGLKPDDGTIISILASCAESGLLGLGRRVHTSVERISVRLQMKNFGMQKPSGASSIEVDDEVHEFTVFDKSHPKSDKIYRMINRLCLDLKRVQVVPKVIRTVFAIHRPKHSFANEDNNEVLDLWHRNLVSRVFIDTKNMMTDDIKEGEYHPESSSRCQVTLHIKQKRQVLPQTGCELAQNV
ncbi:hypothetical protein SADUNF_Sadunf04G0069200 [Salix dunnii]|uniref:Pentatricopeptide repeat-containing protein n=1 Tax=Salix dunnii TaxID=1413687 RepID=A0A835KF53_9ROSI|nr:hypothetical protein SADUNF_Sadunf04G0069200 [Salix dunnii]